MLNVAEDPTPRLAREQVTILDAMVQPGDADTNVAPAGRFSVTRTFVPSSGPPLPAERLYVEVAPEVAFAGPVPERVRLVPCCTALSRLIRGTVRAMRGSVSGTPVITSRCTVAL